MIKVSTSRKVFVVCNYTFLALLAVICLVPVWHVLCISLSDNRYAVSGNVGLWPKGFTLEAYNFLTEKSDFYRAFLVSVKRVILGTALNMIFCITTAYPLSRSNAEFRFRTIYVWFFAITMFWGGGLIPFYFVVTKTGIGNTIWALVLPGAVGIGNGIMMLNFFRGIPKALDEAARLDGAGHLTVMFRIYVPMSTACMATILLFTSVGHWNEWFGGLLYLNSPTQYPLQTYLMNILNSVGVVNKMNLTQEEIEQLSKINEKTIRMAQVFLGALPIMCVYPFLQRYFVKGIVVGSVKG